MKIEIFEVVNQRLEYLKNLAEIIKNMQQFEPEGKLRISNKKGKIQKADYTSIS